MRKLSDIRQNMPVIGSDGQLIGTARGISGDRLLLMGAEDASLPTSLIEQVAQDVRLSEPAREVIAKWLKHAPSTVTGAEGAS